MIEEGLLLPMNVLLQGQKLTLLDPEMWFLRGNENKDVTLVITIGNNHQKLMVVEDILLLIDRSQIEVTAGKVIYHPLRIDILSKLLAFIDESTGSVEREHHELFADALPFASEVVLFSKVASEAWFLATYLSSDNINEILLQNAINWFAIYYRNRSYRLHSMILVSFTAYRIHIFAVYVVMHWVVKLKRNYVAGELPEPCWKSLKETVI